jgi:hypothetical protein
MLRESRNKIFHEILRTFIDHPTLVSADGSNTEVFKNSVKGNNWKVRIWRQENFLVSKPTEENFVIVSLRS